MRILQRSLTDLDICGRKAEVGKTAVFDIENGKQTVQFNMLQSVCRALNIMITLESPIMKQCEEELNAKG